MKQTTINVAMTPEQVAEAFCALSESTKQAEFFAHVRRITERDYYWPERHWHYMCATMHGEDMAEPLPDGMADEARGVLMEMTAPLYLHTLRAVDDERRTITQDALRSCNG